MCHLHAMECETDCFATLAMTLIESKSDEAGVNYKESHRMLRYARMDNCVKEESDGAGMKNEATK
jgi:hypothetical protein